MATILIFLTLVASWLLGFNVAFPSILMGVGIAIDVMLATIAKFRDDDLSFKNWTLPIMATHIGFPAIGYYGFWGATQAWPWLGPTFGIIGAVFVVLFIYEVFSDWIGHEPIFGISAFVGGLFGFEEDDARRMVAIMAVSWDALWSGPAKAAQATTGGWTDFEVACSFGIAGLVVAAAAQLSLKIALRLRQRKFDDASKMSSYSMVGMFAETSVIGGFGVLSLSQGLGASDNIYHAIGVAAVGMGLLFLVFFKRIRASTLDEAEEAIAG
jgi:hypothetical protein